MAAVGHAVRGIALVTDRTYLKRDVSGDEDMPALASPVLKTRPVVLLGLVAGVLVAATAGLWAYYGTAVFFEVVRAGWMACF